MITKFIGVDNMIFIGLFLFFEFCLLSFSGIVARYENKSLFKTWLLFNLIFILVLLVVYLVGYVFSILFDPAEWEKFKEVFNIGYIMWISRL